MNPEMKQVALEPAALREAVRAAVGSADAEVVEWTSARLEGGVMSDVFRVWGTCRSGDGGGDRPWSLVVKLLEDSPHSDDSEAGERELRFYRLGLVEMIGAGIRAPRLHYTDQPSPTIRRLWLEDVPGRSGGALAEGDYLTIAWRLGLFHAAAAQQPCGFHQSGLTGRHHVAEAGERWRRTREREAEAAPERTSRIPPEHHRLLDDVRSRGPALAAAWSDLPPTLCHRTAFASNVLLAEESDGPRVTLIDWDQAGIGAIGEDPCDLLLGALLDGNLPLESGERLLAGVQAAYCRGLADGGLDEAVEQVRGAFLLGIALHWYPRVAAVTQRSRDGRELTHYRALLDLLAPLVEEAVAGASAL